MKKEILEQISKFKVVQDSREQNPFKFPNTIIKALDAGDYTVEYDGKIYSDQIIIERKSSVSEIFSATGKQRDRWERELEKLKLVPIKFVLCEFSYMSFVNEQPPGMLPVSCVYGSLPAWHVEYGIPFIFCENRQNARDYAWKIMFEFTKKNILRITDGKSN